MSSLHCLELVIGNRLHPHQLEHVLFQAWLHRGMTIKWKHSNNTIVIFVFEFSMALNSESMLLKRIVLPVNVQSSFCIPLMKYWKRRQNTSLFVIGTADPFAESINIYDQSMANTVTKYVSETIKFCSLKRWGCLPNRDCSYTWTLKCVQTCLEFWPKKAPLQRNCHRFGNLLTQQGQCFF